MRTRFAPAPTGALHLGHVVNMIYVWSVARMWNAQVLLRIEDHDRQRSRPDFERQLLDDLDWLGFAPDLYPTSAFRSGACESRQSDRQALYARMARTLSDRGLVYACSCSRHDVAQASPLSEHGRRYRGTCRDRGLPLEGPHAWRVTLGAESRATWEDLILPASDTPTEHHGGDPVIRDRKGNWTYQFAVVVDDWDQGIDLVVRGRDLAASTPLQLQIAALLGRSAPPRFAHHALLMRSATEKLSKSRGDTGIADLRAQGWTADRVVGHAAAELGLVTGGGAVAREELAALVARQLDARRSIVGASLL